ncbi:MULTISPECIES: rod shape-determining protein MreC [Deinococcus]|uniref:Cell shape-determining protein MreC n=1 Tax=Deinococcus rufus TaxID=2136097 RepID=A0ABV7ZC58_9DEIO|nr:rod shape-determining protein MreC [Deinococcus sp. AB2017081]WQE93897.1 rod shape-determining protein MreC [Deinococcus sp. AB2017081]
MNWRRLLLVYALLLGLSMVATRFQVVAPTALRSTTVPITRVSVTVADNLRHAYDSLVHERALARDNAELRRQNDVLRQRNELLTREAARLRQLDVITRTQAPNAVGIAQVVAVSPTTLTARLTLNLGRNAGVRIRMPVTVPGGLIGQVTDVAASQSTVVALVDPESSVGVSLDGNKGGRGLARGLPPDRLRAEFSRSVPVKVGDVLVTNSLGGVFPVGIRVGTVEQVMPLGPNDVSRVVIVKPAVDVGVVEDVTILEGL